MKRVFAAALAVLALLMPTALPAAAVLNTQPPAAAQRAVSPDVLVTAAGVRLALVSCTIRNTGTGWAVLDNSGHTPSNCTGLVQYSDHLELQHAVGAVRVSSLAVTTDETYARAGLRAGASVGFALSNIYLYVGAAGTPPVDPVTVNDPNGNLWVQGYLRLP